MNQRQPREEWRPITDWPSYDVSDLGRIRRGRGGQGARSGRVRKQDPGGPYCIVRLSASGRLVARRRVDELVAEAFLGPRPEGMEVRHRNGATQDSRACNLEYAQCSEAHSVPKARGERVNTAKLTADQVREIRHKYAAGGGSQKELGRHYGVSQAEVGYIVLRQTWAHV